MNKLVEYTNIREYRKTINQLLSDGIDVIISDTHILTNTDGTVPYHGSVGTSSYGMSLENSTLQHIAGMVKKFHYRAEITKDGNYITVYYYDKSNTERISL